MNVSPEDQVGRDKFAAHIAATFGLTYAEARKMKRDALMEVRSSLYRNEFNEEDDAAVMRLIGRKLNRQTG